MSIERNVTEYVLNEEEKVEGMESFGLVLTFPPPSPHPNDDSNTGISVIGRGVNKKFAKHNAMKQLHQYLDGSLAPTSHFIENEMKCEKEEEEDEKDEVGYNILGTNEACTLEMNLIDSPGHVDFSSEVTSALRMSDGSLLVVDAVEGVSPQTKTVLKQSFIERVKPILFINKCDRLFLELQMTAQEAAERIQDCILEVNGEISRLSNETQLPFNWEVSLIDGSVTLGSAYFGWALSLPQMIKQACQSEEEATSILERKKGQERLSTSFVRDLITKPLRQLHKCVENQNVEIMRERFGLLGVEFSSDDLEQPWKKQLKLGLSKAFPILPCILSFTVEHHPSPQLAQKYRSTCLLPVIFGSDEEEKENMKEEEEEEGEVSNISLQNLIEEANPSNPLRMFVTKLVPSDNSSFDKQQSQLIALGRIFSGTLRVRDNVYIHSSSSSSLNSISNIPSARVYKLVVFHSPKAVHQVQEASAGDIVGIYGVDQFIVKSATISDSQLLPNECFSPLPFVVSPILGVSIRPKQNEKIHKFISAVSTLSKIDPCVQIKRDEDSDQMVLSGSGELHLEVLLTSLQELFKGEIESSKPRPAFRESILSSTLLKNGDEMVLGKSPNKLNRLWFQASPIHEDLICKMESGEFFTLSDQMRIRCLVDEFGWDTNSAKRIWATGPDEKGPNFLVDSTTSVVNLPAVKSSIMNAFQQLTASGPLTGSKLRGVRFDLMDADIHGDPSHRGPGAIIPSSLRSMTGAMLYADVRLVESLYEVSVSIPLSLSSTVCSVISGREGLVENVEVIGEDVAHITGKVAVRNAIGFGGDIRGDTSGLGSTELKSGGWRVMELDPYENDEDLSKSSSSKRSQKKKSNKSKKKKVEEESKSSSLDEEDSDEEDGKGKNIIWWVERLRLQQKINPPHLPERSSFVDKL